MKKYDEIDDHILGTFVDGQLDTVSAQFILKAMDNDLTVRERVYQLRRAKDLMKLGFADTKPPALSDAGFRFSQWSPGAYRWVASILILIAGATMGVLGYHNGKQLGHDSAQALAAMAQPQYERVILHISKSDPKEFASVLAYTTAFLKKHQAQGHQVAVIANAAGLDLLRVGVSPYEKQINALMQDYKNVHFIACANAIRALRKKNIEPVFHKGVDTSTPAFDQILSRVQDGWTYIKAGSLLKI